MAKEYHPRREVLNFIKYLCDKEGRDGQTLCAGRKTYSLAEIYDEVKKGTPFGRRVYQEVESLAEIISKNLIKSGLGSCLGKKKGK